MYTYAHVTIAQKAATRSLEECCNVKNAAWVRLLGVAVYTYRLFWYNVHDTSRGYLLPKSDFGDMLPVHRLRGISIVSSALKALKFYSIFHRTQKIANIILIHSLLISYYFTILFQIAIVFIRWGKTMISPTFYMLKPGRVQLALLAVTFFQISLFLCYNVQLIR